MPQVAVKFKHGIKGQTTTPSITSKTFNCPGKSESAVIAELKRTNPNYGEIVILDMVWK